VPFFPNEDSAILRRIASRREDHGPVCPPGCPHARGGIPERPSLWIRRAGTIASVLTIGCALVLAVDRLAPMRWLFLTWSIANALWVIYALKIGSPPLLASQVVFCGIDVIGVLHYWFH
jgi:hypothetical protein